MHRSYRLCFKLASKRKERKKKRRRKKKDINLNTLPRLPPHIQPPNNVRSIYRDFRGYVTHPRQFYLGQSVESHARSANGLLPGCPPYQLPPPRASAASLPLETKPFLSYYAPAERSDSPSAPHSNDIRSSATRNEPLPSVSQLLTHTSSPSPPLHYPPPFEPSPPRDFPQPAHHHDHGLSIKLSRAFIFGDSASPQKSRPRRQSGGSPLLSDAALQDSGAKSRPLSATNLSTLSWISHEGSHLYFSNGHHDGEQNTGISQSNNVDSGLATGNHTQKKPPIRPHVVDERYIEGEGLCYIYADGSHCPKSIDGMPVNANWGITKAGKPRKRLAQACLTCREKKIKCQPNLPRCDQCQKSGRDCRFENA